MRLPPPASMLPLGRWLTLILLFGVCTPAGCANDLGEFGSFPCAQDDTCPASYVCAGSNGCVPAAEARELSPFECASGGVCPEHFYCVGPEGCVHEEEVAGFAPFPCAERGGDAESCPSGYACIPSGDCAGCNPTNELDACEPWRCEGGSCGVGDRFCHPGEDLCITADDVEDYPPIACDGGCPAAGLFCVDGECLTTTQLSARVPFDCAEDLTCPPTYVCLNADEKCVPREPCDPVSQTGCNDAARSKCSLVNEANVEDSIWQCVDSFGDIPINQPCQWQFDDKPSTGRDDCRAGGACAREFVGDEALCRQFCDSPCGPGEACIAVTDDAGYCLPECTPGEECGEGNECNAYSISFEADRVGFLCAERGVVAFGDPCDVPTECAPGLTCFYNRCQPLCGPQLGCPTGGGCNLPLTGDIKWGCDCQLLVNGSCGPGLTCRLAGSVDDGLTGTCSPVGVGYAGAACDTAADCGEHQTCWGSDVNGYFCRDMCRVGLPCNGGFCEALDGLEGLGLCL